MRKYMTQMDGNNTDSQNTEIFFPRDLVDMLKSSGSCVGLQEPEKRSSYNHKKVLVKRNIWSPCNAWPPTPARSSAHVTVIVKVSVLVLFMPTAKRRVSFKNSGAVSELHWTLPWCELWSWHSWLTLYGIGACGWLFPQFFWSRPRDRVEHCFLHRIWPLAFIKLFRRNTSLKQAVEVVTNPKFLGIVFLA